MNEAQLKDIQLTLDSAISKLWHVGFPSPELQGICNVLEAEAEKLRAITNTAGVWNGE